MIIKELNGGTYRVGWGEYGYTYANVYIDKQVVTTYTTGFWKKKTHTEEKWANVYTCSNMTKELWRVDDMPEQKIVDWLEAGWVQFVKSRVTNKYKIEKP